MLIGCVSLIDPRLTIDVWCIINGSEMLKYKNVSYAYLDTQDKIILPSK